MATSSNASPRPYRFPSAPDTYDPRVFNQIFKTLWLWLDRFLRLRSSDIGITAIRTTTSTTVTVGLDDGMILVDTSGGNVAVSLPDPSLCVGQEFSIKRITGGANTLVITPAAGNVDGSATANIDFQYVCLNFKSDASNYWIR
jgi:hypothetical protein